MTGASHSSQVILQPRCSERKLRPYLNIFIFFIIHNAYILAMAIYSVIPNKWKSHLSMNKALKIGLVYIFSIFLFIILVNAGKDDEMVLGSASDNFLPKNSIDPGQPTANDQNYMLDVFMRLLSIARRTSYKVVTYSADMSNAVDCVFQGINISVCSPNLLNTTFTPEMQEFDKETKDIIKNGGDTMASLPETQQLQNQINELQKEIALLKQKTNNSVPG
jgi:hypothetical protein